MSQDTPAPAGRNPDFQLPDAILEREMVLLLPKLRKGAFRFVRTLHEAEDLAQETFLKAWANRHRYVAGNLAGWMSTILRNEFLSQCRKRKREVGGDEDFWKTIDAEHHATAPAVDERLDLERAFQEMPEDKFRTILHVDILENSYQTICQQTGVAEGTVKSRVFRSRKYLQALLGEAYVPAGRSLPRVKLLPKPQRENRERRALPSPVPLAKETAMDMQALPDDLRHADAISVARLAAEIKKRRVDFRLVFKKLKKDAGLSNTQFQEALSENGITLSLATVHNMFNERGVWNEPRLNVFLGMVGKEPREVLAMTGGGMAPAVAAETAPAARLVEAASTADQMHALVRRLLEERLARGNAAEHLNLLGDLIHRLTR